MLFGVFFFLYPLDSKHHGSRVLFVIFVFSVLCPSQSQSPRQCQHISTSGPCNRNLILISFSTNSQWQSATHYQALRLKNPFNKIFEKILRDSTVIEKIPSESTRLLCISYVLIISIGCFFGTNLKVTNTQLYSNLNHTNYKIHNLIQKSLL